MANAHAQATAEQEAAVARCRFLAAAALDNARVHAEHCCERLEEGFIRERDRAAVAELVLADRGVLLREERAMVSEVQDRRLACRPGLMSLSSSMRRTRLRALVYGDGHGKNRTEANTNEEVVWTLAEEHEDIQDDVAFVDGDWNENAAVFEQKDPLDTVSALDADDAAPNDEVVKEAETAVVEGEAVDFPEVDFDRKYEATLRDVVAEEVLAPAVGAPPTGWRVDRFPQGPGRMRFVSTSPWSLRPPTCEPELWLIIGKAAQRDEGERYADDRDAFAAQEERCPSWRRAKRGGVVACGVQAPLVDGGGELRSWSCAMLRIQRWLPWWLSTLW